MGYARLMGERMAYATAALDIETGGGEVLAGVAKLPPLTVATESWPPNIVRATRLLHPRGVAVVVHDGTSPLPFGDDARVDLRAESLRTEFHDIGAVVYFLRKVIWIVPGFTVEEYRTELAALHDRIRADGPFVATTRRFLIEAWHERGSPQARR